MRVVNRFFKLQDACVPSVDNIEFVINQMFPVSKIMDAWHDIHNPQRIDGSGHWKGYRYSVKDHLLHDTIKTWKRKFTICVHHTDLTILF